MAPIVRVTATIKADLHIGSISSWFRVVRIIALVQTLSLATDENVSVAVSEKTKR